MSNRAWELIGWWLFVACAAFFIIASARSGDILALIGSVLFMAANVAFLVPYYAPQKDERNDEDGRKDD